MKRFVLAAALTAAAAAPALAIIPVDWQFHARPYPVLSWQDGSSDPFSLDCRGAQGVQVHVGTIVHMRQRPSHVPTVPVTVISGSARVTQTATGDWNAEGSSMRFQVNVPAASPVLTEFARTGELSARALGDIDVYPVVPRALARRFVAACRAHA